MDNRQDLIRVGLLLFAQRGYEAVGVQELVEAAEVTKPTLYHYFQSKRGLLEAILVEGFHPFLDEFDQTAVYRHDLVQTLTSLTKLYFQFSCQDSIFFRFQLGLQFSPPDSVSYQTILPYNEIQSTRIIAIFRAAEQDHGNMKGRSNLYADSYRGMIHAHALNLINSAATANDQYTYRTVHQFMHGIFS